MPWDPRTGILEPETQNPETRTPRIELVTHRFLVATDPTTDCINFNCEAHFDNKKLGIYLLGDSSIWVKIFYQNVSIFETTQRN